MALMNNNILNDQMSQEVVVQLTIPQHHISEEHLDVQLKASQDKMNYLTHQLGLVKQMKWIETPNMFIASWTSLHSHKGLDTFPSLTDAQNMCWKVAGCTGITKTGNPDSPGGYQLRSGNPQVSDNQETSWLKPGVILYQ